MKKLIILICIIFTGWYQASCQQVEEQKLKALVIDGDTMPMVDLSEVHIYKPDIKANSAEARRFDRLVYNVKRVYPYARLAGIKFNEYTLLLADVKSEKVKKAMMKKAQDELEAQFGNDLKSMTFSQGKILLKLVDRQTGNSSYELLQEFRGRFVAFFWQSFARVFGYNLKVSYDPLGEDKDIELIVLMIENNTI
jgi:hypothetical protein